MSILETEVWVELSNRISKYYEDLGYDIPRYIDNSRRLRIARGTKILVKVTHLSPSSNVKLTKICDEENCKKHVHNQKYEAILRNRDKIDGKDRCGECGRKRAGNTQKINIRNGKSLETWAIENNKEYLLVEFNDSNNKKPNQISYGSADEYIWDCFKCNNNYKMSAHHRTSGDQNCPYCVGKKILKGYNDLWTTHPDIAKLLKNPQRGYEITAGSKKQEEFMCEKCGNVDKKIIMNATRQGFACSKCSDGLSYPEKFMINFLDQLNIVYEKQKVFEWSDKVICEKQELIGRKIYDFYIPDMNCVIETHGMQHFEKSFDTIKSNLVRSLEDEKQNDILKEQLAKDNQVLYIMIDAKQSSMKWIRNSIQKSELSIMFDLLKINWLKCHEFAINNLIEVACNYWVGGIKSTVNISKLMNCARGTIVRYLKVGAELGWCDYNPKEEMIKNGLNTKGRNIKKVIQFSLENKFIKEWSSIINASNTLELSATCISNVCRGKQKTAGGFKWSYA